MQAALAAVQQLASQLDRYLAFADANGLSTNPDDVQFASPDNIRHDDLAGTTHLITLLNRSFVHPVRRIVEVMHRPG